MKILEKIIDIICVIMMFTLFIVILLQILFRYFFNMPLKWTEELARYVFVWVSMMGWTYGSRYDTHIQVNIFSNLFPEKIKSFVFLFIQLLSIIFSLALGYYSIGLVKQGYVFKATTLPINFSLVYSIIPIVCLILIIYAVMKIYNFIKNQGKVGGN